jgi:hypothetical protein
VIIKRAKQSTGKMTIYTSTSPLPLWEETGEGRNAHINRPEVAHIANALSAPSPASQMP